jgi:formylglycine-generating enzyme
MKTYFLLSCFCLISLLAGTAFKRPYDVYRGFSLKAFESTLALIPAGNFIIGQCDEDVPYVPLEKCRTVHTDTFYISKFEVSNGQYLEFLSEIAKQDREKYAAMLPDTMVWRNKYAYNEPYVEYYLRHPAYSNYPVVGVSYEQAEAFCAWLTDKYMREKKRRFKQVRFKLPTSEQWVFAAKGKLDNSSFPWKGLDLQNRKGEWLANFRAVPQVAIVKDSAYVKNANGDYEKRAFNVAGDGYSTSMSLSVSDQSDITAPVRSFYPNGYGLYNMAGNVEELVREKGKTHGGSWTDTGFYLQNNVAESYDSLHATSAERGFRFVMEVIR